MSETIERTKLRDGQVFEHQGKTFRFEVKQDESMGEPWKEHNGHGVVTDWITLEEYNLYPEGCLLLGREGYNARFYNLTESIEIAKRDGWGPGTPEEAARADFEHLKAWCNDEWYWVGVVVTLLKEDEDAPDGYFETKHVASLWGIESTDTDYLSEVGYELAEELTER